MSLDPTPRRRRCPHDRRSLARSIIVVTAVVATVIVVVTGGTAGLADLATLILSVSAVAVPLATSRRARRKK
ncbi:MAG: hypothetical protein ACRDTD_05685 [Pseudonocardiaceae bacterium]